MDYTFTPITNRIQSYHSHYFGVPIAIELSREQGYSTLYLSKEIQEAMSEHDEVHPSGTKKLSWIDAMSLEVCNEDPKILKINSHIMPSEKCLEIVVQYKEPPSFPAKGAIIYSELKYAIP